MRHPLRAAVLAAALVTTAACGSGTPESQAPAGGAPPEPTSAAASALFDALPDTIKESGVIRFAGDSHPPYRTVGSDGTITGIDKDMQDALGKILGVRTEISVVDSLPSALQGMLSDRYDAFNGPVKATAEREQQFDSITWMTTRTSYVVPAGSTAGIAGPDDLCGKKVAIVTASVVEGQLANLSAYCQQRGRPAAEAVPLADTNATLLAAQAGRADAAGMTQAAAIDVTTQQKDAYTYVTQTEEQGATTDNLALLVPKSAGMGPVMFDAFEELFAGGEYQKIMDKWGLTEVAVPAPVLNAGSAG
ncbi:transporter substrate-binding domain-containing protein [Pseudonocardia lacus]|uniref:transporter substrate-binding domain-containing protein n=1 Tax=Pseudonocardia lacus TaxID=2835865 RepID=UPI001BDC2276|nr:transporter substrate-binding domain-containing protein [Pseudonocardia lacus]